MQMFETYQYAISRKNQRVIWGTVIVLIVIAMFAVGIVSAVVKGKKENGETNEHK
jgi:membrane protein YdbS with pleckstrin-like domain